MLKPGQLATERIEELEYEIERLCAEVRNLHEMIGEIERQHAVTIAVALQERYGMRCPSEIERQRAELDHAVTNETLLRHDVQRQSATIADLTAALEHMRWCRHCAEGAWEDCEGGREALAAIAKNDIASGTKMKIKIKIPVIVTADGKWAANGSHSMEEPDWAWIDEMIDHDKPTVSPHRLFVEATVEVPTIEIVQADVITSDQ